MNAREEGSGRTKRALAVSPTEIRQGDELVLTGARWPDCPLEIRAGDRAVPPIRIARGFPVGRKVRPAGDGMFVVSIATADLRPGRRTIRVDTGRKGETESVTVEVVEQPEPGSEGRVEKPVWRAREFFERRFGHIGFVPPGTRPTQVESVRSLRARRAAHRRRPGRPDGALAPDDVFAQPDPAVCNWTPVGAAPVVTSLSPGAQGWSGRTLAVAIDPTNPSVVYVGTAGGGVWKTLDAGETWTPLTDYAMSLSVGAIAIDPSGTQRVLAGTGEYNNGYVGTYYGNGVLRSADGGATWTEHATATFERDEISRIHYDPSDSTGQSVLLSSSIGIYASSDGGSSWMLVEAGNFSDLVVFEAGGNKLDAIAARYGDGLYTATRTGSSWSAWTKIVDPDIPTSFGRAALGQRGPNSKVVYAIFERFGGIEGVVSTDNGGTTWSAVDVRLSRNVSVQTNTASGHFHTFTIPQADMTAAPAAHTYTTNSAGSPGHTHTVSLSSDEFVRVARGGVVITSTDADGTGHQHPLAIASAGQGGYNLHVSPHPSDPNTVFIGEVNLWRSTGGGVYTAATGIHVDHHAFAFDPVTATTVWAGSDGGAWRSTNTGGSWQHRNRDLGTLMYIGLAQHPQWDSVLLAGTQDNGTHRFEGSPAWLLSVGGDGGFTAIDAATPTRMYHLFFGPRIQRSDSAGEPGTWMNKTTGITGSSQFYAPFVLDASNPDTCYFGGTELFRSSDRGDNWTAVTSTVGTAITALAVHPADPNTVYVGTGTGAIHRVSNGGSWAPADITVTTVSASPLPTGVYISDLAVDAGGTLWATIGAVLWTESTGEFTNDHVWRLASTSGATWENRSAGLAQANPVNAIAIDPTNANRLFCGADIGVFRTENAGMSWEAWDEGLPNAPVYRLAIHGPRRLLRAATHGRSIWERPIDTGMCSMVDLYVRDNILDSGRVTPSPSGQPHPFQPGTNVYWWQSADIKVDAPEPTYQTTSPIDDTIDFMVLDHRNPTRGELNRFSLQVHNRGVSQATNVRARAFFADASAGLPNLPSDFWSAGKPFLATPTATDWTPIGPTMSVAELEAAEPAVLTWEWTVPMSAAKHSCLLGVVTCDQDPIAASGIFDLGSLVPTRKHATLKNLHVVDPTSPSIGSPDGAWQIDLYNPGPETRRFDLVIDWGNLPDRARLLLAVESLGKKLVYELEADRRQRIQTLDGRSTLPGSITGRCGERRRIDLDRALTLRPPKGRVTRLPGLPVPGNGRRLLAMNLARLQLETDVEFSVLQVLDGRIVGGGTYLLRAREDRDER